jgi:hypothetical protein
MPNNRRNKAGCRLPVSFPDKNKHKKCTAEEKEIGIKIDLWISPFE